MATEEIHWKEKRKRTELSLSASQHETFLSCPRKWWLGKVRRLSEPKKDFLTFGTVLHGVIERYLKADELGNVQCDHCKGFGECAEHEPTIGETDIVEGPQITCPVCKGYKVVPVDLYPAGWHIAESRFGAGDDLEPDGEVTIAEQDLIKRLVAKAIEEGVLERREGRVIEGRFERDVTIHGDTKILLTGFKDVSFRDEVEDHKSTKKMAYAKSPNALKKNTQMLLYAYDTIQKALERGEPPPQTITLRHNVFSKEGKVRKTTATVTKEEVENHWHRFSQDAIEMAKLRNRVEVNHEITLPADVSSACNSYGGCPYKSICWGCESEEGYEARIKSQGLSEAQKEEMFKKGLDASSTGITVEQSNIYVPRAQKGSAMSVRDLLLKKTQVSAAAGGVALQAPLPTPVAQAAVAAPVAVAGPSLVQPAVQLQAAPVAQTTPTVAPEGCQPPPWAIATCPACKGKGFNNSGNPCRICDNKHVSDGKASKEFVIEPTGDGKVMWVARDGSCEGESFIGGSAPAAVTVQVKEEKPVAPAAPVAAVQQPAPVVQQQSAPAPVPQEQPATVPANVPVAQEAKAVVSLPSETAEEKIAKKGRPVRSFTIVRNGSVVKGAERIGSGRGVVRLDDLLLKYGSELAKVSNVSSYYELDAFKRRDNLASIANVIAEEIGTDVLVCSGIGTGASDLKSLYEALKPYAGMEIVCEQN